MLKIDGQSMSQQKIEEIDWPKKIYLKGKKYI